VRSPTEEGASASPRRDGNSNLYRRADQGNSPRPPRPTAGRCVKAGRFWDMGKGGRQVPVAAQASPQAMIPVNVAGLSMRTVEWRTLDHTATTEVGPELLSGVTTESVVGTRPVLGGTCSL